MLWKIFGPVINPGKSKKLSNISKLINELGGTVTNNHEIVNEFNKYCTTIGRQLSEKINSKTSYTKYLKKPNHYSLFLSPTTIYEISKIITNLDYKRAAGMDNIRPKLLKACNNELATSLAHFTNLSFLSGNYPDQLKIAKVIPLFKKCEPHLTKNYRLISLLSILNKIIGKLVHKHLYE